MRGLTRRFLTQTGQPLGSAQARPRWTWLVALIAAIAFGLVPVLVIPVPASAWIQGQPFQAGFPRLANWSPDVASQPATSLAQYDYLVLYEDQRGAIPALRQANPQIMLLTYTSAAEIGVIHPLLSEVPNKWLLSQVGSRLTSSVTSETTTFAVATTRVFKIGQLAEVGEELVRVVSKCGSSIGVERGIRPDRSVATGHDKGIRIAGLVQRQSSSIDMNLSTYCPTATVDPDHPGETWAAFIARRTAERCNAAAWDGVVVDRVENAESFLAREGTVASIDAKGTNLLVTDNYTAFDTAWAAGVAGYLRAVRTDLGAHKLVVGNNAAASHYGLLNGTNYESFPRFDQRTLPTISSRDTYARWWNPRLGFCVDWATKGLQPNLSTVMTYDDEVAPPAGVALPLAGTPDYRKFRFGLATALMGDSFFTYQLRVWGPRIGMFWFDEYDNAGQGGKGYLGLPIGDQRLAMSSLASTDKLGGHGSFRTSTDFSKWHLNLAPGYAGAKTRTSGTAKISVSKTGSKVDGVGFYTGYFGVGTGGVYTVKFRARADRNTTVRVRVATRNAPWHDWLAFYEVKLGTSWKTFEFSGYSPGGDSDARVVFDLSGSKKTVWLDDVKVQPGSRLYVLRRDFAGGAALVNGSDRTVTVPLGTQFRKIRGTQVLTINNGALVSQVTLQPRDGIVLLKVSGLTAQRVLTFLTTHVSSTHPTVPGQKVVISGVLKRTTTAGSGAAGQTVYLQSSSNGKDGWKTIGTARSSLSGYLLWSTVPTSKTFYRLRYYGSAGGYFGSVSKSLSVLPAPARP